MDENEIGTIVVTTCIKIHQRLGPGLLESVYETVLEHELNKQGLNVARQVDIAINYDDLHIQNAFKADMIINNKVILELKSVENLNNAHKKQLLTYLKLSNKKLGYLLNFSEELMRHGIHRVVNKL